jgi:hypothetical protein
MQLAALVCAAVALVAQAGAARGQKTWLEADQCDPGNPAVRGKMCKPNTADVYDVSPCDPDNTNVNNRGWLCERNTANVVVSSSSYNSFKNGHSHVIEPAYYEGSTPGLWVIPNEYTYSCSLCDDGWCDSFNGGRACSCDPCDPTSEGGKRGWFCQPNTANICTDEFGLAVLNADVFFGPNNFETDSQTLTVSIPATSLGGQVFDSGHNNNSKPMFAAVFPSSSSAAASPQGYEAALTNAARSPALASPHLIADVRITSTSTQRRLREGRDLAAGIPGYNSISIVVKRSRP